VCDAIASILLKRRNSVVLIIQLANQCLNELQWFEILATKFRFQIVYISRLEYWRIEVCSDVKTKCEQNLERSSLHCQLSRDIAFHLESHRHLAMNWMRFSYNNFMIVSRLFDLIKSALYVLIQFDNNEEWTLNMSTVAMTSIFFDDFVSFTLSITNNSRLVDNFILRLLCAFQNNCLFFRFDVLIDCTKKTFQIDKTEICRKRDEIHNRWWWWDNEWWWDDEWWMWKMRKIVKDESFSLRIRDAYSINRVACSNRSKWESKRDVLSDLINECQRNQSMMSI
jgi:hypothetical protein